MARAAVWAIFLATAVGAGAMLLRTSAGTQARAGVKALCAVPRPLCGNGWHKASKADFIGALGSKTRQARELAAELAR